MSTLVARQVAGMTAHLNGESHIEPELIHRIQGALGLSDTELHSWFSLSGNWQTRGLYPGEPGHIKVSEFAQAARHGNLTHFRPANMRPLEPGTEVLVEDRCTLNRQVVRQQGRLFLRYYDKGRLVAVVPYKEPPCDVSDEISASSPALESAV